MQFCVTSAKQIVYKVVHGVCQSTLLFSWFTLVSMFEHRLIMIKVIIMFYVLF